MGKNEVILYNYFRSSASYRVRLALKLKGVEYTYKAIHLLNNGGEQKTVAFKELNPMGHVPALVINGLVLAESVAIIDYLDSYAPKEPTLFPKEPALRAKTLQVCEMINSGIQPLQNIKVLQHLGTLGLSKDQQTQWMHHWIILGLESVEKFLAPIADSHCMGTAWTAADCFLIPQCFSSARFGVDLTQFPTIHRLYQSLNETDVVKAAHPANQPDAE